MPRSTGPRKAADAASVQLGRAIQRALDETAVGTQEVLADLMGVKQSTISRMITGETKLTVAKIAEIEELCRLPRGQILAWAGFVAPDLVLELADGRAAVIEFKRPTAPAAKRAATAGAGKSAKKAPTKRPHPSAGRDVTPDA